MRIRIRVHCHTSWGQNLFVCGSSEELGSWSIDQAKPMNYLADGYWDLRLKTEEDLETVSYKYFVKHEYGGAIEWEFGDNRVLSIPVSMPEEIVVQDSWRSIKGEQNALFTSIFTDTLLRRPKSGPSRKKAVEGQFVHRFQIYAPALQPDQVVAIAGNDKALGNWNPSKAIYLNDRQFPLWSVDVALDDPGSPLEFKFIISDKKSRSVLHWEAGDNRYVTPEYGTSKSRLVCFTAENFRHPHDKWRGTGVAVPVFSLRSESGTGVGEFSDLKLLIDWAAETGMSMIQVLPVNDTVATHTWKDSYPYAAISVFALHPIYANLEGMGQLKDEKARAKWEKKRQQLNKLPEVDYDEVMKAKSQYFKQLFDQDWKKVSRTKAFKTFFKENQHWLEPYAVFCSLRDTYETVKFSEWPDHQVYDAAAIAKIAAPSSESYEDVAIHYFIQFHLDQQLSEVKAYAIKRRVAIKGDIPIGIYRHSVDAWVSPHLYNMNGQAGAPPDAFATAGQNWGFPTYDWQEMEKDGFTWWKERLIQLSRYFDSFRIDHILGFFRIWQIPINQVQGILGQFNPAMPFYRDELSRRGLWFDEDRMVKPYICEHFLEEFVGIHVDSVKREFLMERKSEPGRYDMKPEFATQRQVEAYISDQEKTNPESKEYYEEVKEGLYGLIAQVIFLAYPESDGHAFSPRIALHFTKSYAELDPGSKAALDALYVDFFYHRHESFWRDQAMIKLPAIKEATNMLVCGEDLGMVPECVPGVMDELCILSLEIQRMPKDSGKKFGHPGDSPYLSVISTSTHDMPTLRGWWEEDQATSQQFFNQILNHQGSAPFYCEPWVARDIILQHLYSPAMWAIFPIQDLFAVDGRLRREDPLEEQINVPATPNHYWRYRLHLPLEKLLKEKEFNRTVGGMIAASGRK